MWGRWPSLSYVAAATQAGGIAAPAEPENMLTNGDFSSGATGWTFTNSSGASSITDKINFNDEAGDVDRARQAVAGLTNGSSYTVTGVVSGRTLGFIQVALGGFVVGANVSANGAFTRTGVAGSSGEFMVTTTGAGGVMSVDDLVLTAD